MFDTGPLFPANYNSTADIVINQGGTDSGKTYTLIQIAAFICATHPATPVDPIFSVISASVPNSKKGAYRIFESISTNPYIAKRITHWDKTNRVITFKTGWILEFLGVTTEQNAKQGKRQFAFMNETDGIPWPIFWQYAKRTRQRVYVDYNPSAPFWAHDKLINTLPEANDLNAVVQLIISDHRHNPFLSQRDHDKTENIKDIELWKVYARGMTGNLMGMIFNDWTMIPDEEFPRNEGERFGGLDFGYTNDPTAGLDIVVKGTDVYIHEMCYEPDIPEAGIMELYKARGYTNEIVYCERDVTLLRGLKKAGLRVKPALKGPGSVMSGIMMIRKQYKVFYTASSQNIAFELKRYMYEKDIATGRYTNTPIDQFNHLMDAFRYGLYTKYFKKNNKI